VHPADAIATRAELVGREAGAVLLVRVVGRLRLGDEAVRREHDDAAPGNALQCVDQRKRRIALEVLDHVERDHGIDARGPEDARDVGRVGAHEGGVRMRLARGAECGGGQIDADGKSPEADGGKWRRDPAADVEHRVTVGDGGREGPMEDPRPERREGTDAACRQAAPRGSGAGSLRRAAIPTRYAASAASITVSNPYAIARTVARTELTTEKKPFTPQLQAMNSSRCGVSAATVRRPSGMNAPRQTPSGRSTPTAIGTRAAKGNPAARVVSGVRPKR